MILVWKEFFCKERYEETLKMFEKAGIFVFAVLNGAILDDDQSGSPALQ